MKIKPAGYFVLVDVTPVKSVSDGGIILSSDTVMKEQMAEETGTIVAFGPTAFVGMRGCEQTEEEIRAGIWPPQKWGLKVGDKVEFKRFEGKKSYVKGFENFRYIPDTHIIGVINDE